MAGIARTIGHMLQAPVIHLLPSATLRRTRLLPHKGSVLVRAGQQVSALEVIAESPPHRKHLLIDACSALNISRNQFSREMIRRQAGDVLMAGDIIVETKRTFNRVLRAPVACEVLLVSGSNILLEVSEKPLSLKAGLSGVIKEVIPDYGAVLEISGALLQGVWGNGCMDMGALRMLVQQPEDELKAGSFDTSMSGSVGVGGCCCDAAALKAAAALPLNGLILGSMSANLVEMALKLRFPLIIIDGFGKHPLNRVAFKILSANEKRETCLNAAPINRFRGERPEILIPLPVENIYPLEGDDFRGGQIVRITNPPYLGMVGTIEEIFSEPVLLANGLRLHCAAIRLDDQEIMNIPLNNLEVIE